MNPDEIDVWTNAVIKLHTAAEQFGPGLVLASCLVTGWWTCRWICRRVFQAYDWARERRQLRATPAAFDNQPPQDDDALVECQRIAREPERDPGPQRAANRYLRKKGDETP